MFGPNNRQQRQAAQRRRRFDEALEDLEFEQAEAAEDRRLARQQRDQAAVGAEVWEDLIDWDGTGTGPSPAETAAAIRSHLTQMGPAGADTEDLLNVCEADPQTVRRVLRALRRTGEINHTIHSGGIHWWLIEFYG